MKIGLGTVQFGIDYGISNHNGKTPLDEVEKILDVAMRNGISVIDTAALYGTSEEVLGKTLPECHRFKIVTKTPRFTSSAITSDDVRRLEDSFFQSLHKMKCAAIYGLLFHNADDLLSENGHILFNKMTDLKQKGLVEKIGVSVYTALQIDEILGKFQIDIIQLPINVFDQHLLVSGHLSKLKKRGVEIHVRSAFLQGLLLMSSETLPPFFDSVREHLKDYQRTIHQHGLTLVRAALGFLINIPDIDFIICGVNNHTQLKEICREAVPVESIDFSRFALSDGEILNPSNWRL
ncbi:MAG: aldo/keto reductase [Deltaproteobacteria bacterium]|nr:aldo/keto reductase [Deltaproteobacteria bacterium]